jgi:putative ABC transport system permease protein
VVLLRTIYDSIKFALSALVTNKLRTFLSLLGITIGIFCIISVMAVIDSLEGTIRDNVSSLGNNTIYVQKWPWTFGPDYPWWKYLKRPLPSIEEFEFVKDNSQLAEAVCFMASASRTAEYGNTSIDGTGVILITQDYNNIRVLNFAKGRYITPIEFSSGKNVAFIGDEIAKNLFGSADPIGKTIKISGHKIVVIGVLEREGEDMFGMNQDNYVIIPVNYGRTIFNIRSENVQPMIMVSANEDIRIEMLQDELQMLMRTVRRISPLEEDDFALNRASMISQGLDQIFSIIDLAGIIIGGFAILVGGFGIANIMFVSVRERTRMIGIQKAIGAKKYLILIQFLTEAVVLCIIGGAFGLLLVWFGTLAAAGAVQEIKFVLSAKNIVTGLLISVIIGIISGFAPARAAANLDPVDAMNKV